MNDLRIYVIPHIHADLCWPDIPEVCINECVASIMDTLRFLEKAPHFRFTMEHTFYLREFLARYPDKKEVIRDLIGRKVFECGAFYLGPTELTAGPESLIRELYYGKRWLREFLGVDSNIVWNVDCPGHTQQMPQILAKGGVDAFVIWKEFPVFEKDYSGYVGPYLFRWEAPDGSQVTVCHTPEGYGTAGTLGLRGQLEMAKKAILEFVERWQAHIKVYNLPPVLFIADGTDIQRPSLQVLKNIERWNAEKLGPGVTLASTSEFFAALSQCELPTSKGEMPNWWDIVQSFELDRVLRDRRAESKLLAAETFGAFASVRNEAFEYRQDHLDRAWENRLFASEHNEGGNNGHVSDERKLNKVKAADILAENALKDALYTLASGIKMKPRGIPVVVYNRLSWDRSDVAEITIGFNKREMYDVHVEDATGNEVPSQVVEIRRYADDSIRKVTLLFVADVPAVGYSTYYVVEGKPTVSGQIAAVRGDTIENDYYRLTIDASSGGIASIVDKRTGRELINSERYFANELVAYEEVAHDECEYLTGRFWKSREFPAKVRVKENGPVRAVLTVEGPIKGGNRLQETILYRKLDRIDFETKLDWYGERNIKLVVTYPFAQDMDELTYEVPFAHVRFGEEHEHWRKIHPSIRGVRNWLRVSSKESTVTLSTEVIPNDLMDRLGDPVPGYVIQPILLRTTYSCYDHLKQMRYSVLTQRLGGPKELMGAVDFLAEEPSCVFAQEGTYRFRFSVCSDNGAMPISRSVRLGWEHNSPLIPVVWKQENLRVLHRHLTFQIGEGGDAPEAHSFCRIHPENIVLSTAKRAEDGDGVILRLHEADGKGTVVRLTFDKTVKAAWRTDIIEYNKEPLSTDGPIVEIPIGAFAIETIRVKFK